MSKEEFMWSEKYRPHCIEDIVLPPHLKAIFRDCVKAGEFSNMIFSGDPGMGKTTVAKALCEEIGVEYLYINGSLDGNIDTLRETIQRFATSKSFESVKRKCVIYDEFDYSNISSTQPALRGVMEEFSKNCSFILTANYPERILKEIKSRAPEIEFKIKPEEKRALATEFYRKVLNILALENVKYEKELDVAHIVNEYFPDMRKCLNVLQLNVVDGFLDFKNVKLTKNFNVSDVFRLLKDKDFTNLRDWVSRNDPDFVALINYIYDKYSDFIYPESYPENILILANYQEKYPRALNKQINTLAMLTEMMYNLKYK